MYEYSKGSEWRYIIINSLTDEQVGVKFHRPRTASPYEFKVLFAGQIEVCMDWANLNHNAFFDKYSIQGRAPETVRMAEQYLKEKQTVPEKRKRLNLRIIE